MFIRKWRYEQNLDNARQEGRREGHREANEQKFAYIDYLEEANKALQEQVNAARKNIEILRHEMETDSIPKKSVVEALANELACYQKQADVAYYDCSDQETSDDILEKAMAIKELANLLALGGDVYERAYQIYDFRNSGKKGYTLKDGKIVKVEQEDAEPECPFVEETEQENHTDGSECEGCPGWCPENAGTPDCPENSHGIQRFPADEDWF